MQAMKNSIESWWIKTNNIYSSLKYPSSNIFEKQPNFSDSPLHWIRIKWGPLVLMIGKPSIYDLNYSTNTFLNLSENRTKTDPKLYTSTYLNPCRQTLLRYTVLLLLYVDSTLVRNGQNLTYGPPPADNFLTNKDSPGISPLRWMRDLHS